MLIEIIAKAAANNHGLTLQPAQVQELLAALAGQQTQLTAQQHRLNTATRLITVMLGEDQLDFPVADLDNALDGFWVYHDKEAATIRIGPGQEIPEGIVAEEPEIVEAEIVEE